MFVGFEHISHIVLVFQFFEQVNAGLVNMSMDAEIILLTLFLVLKRNYLPW